MITIVKHKFTPMRRQVLVLNCERILSSKELDALNASIKKQMAEGLVILPPGFQGFTVDNDYLFESEAE